MSGPNCKNGAEHGHLGIQEESHLSGQMIREKDLCGWESGEKSWKGETGKDDPQILR